VRGISSSLRSTKLFWLVGVVVASGCVSSAPIVPLSPASTSTPPPSPEVSVSAHTQYYEISGVAGDDLRAQMDELGPGDHDVYTSWFIRWTYPDVVTDATCAVGPVEVSLSITYTLPQWDAPPGAPVDLVEKWNAYLAALQLHEAGHKDIAVAAGNEIRKTLSALPAYPSCEELHRSGEAASQDVMDRYRLQEVQYDQQTDHGATQGARFP